MDTEATTPAQDEAFFPVNLIIMQPGTAAPVNLYIKVSDPPSFTLYKKAQARLPDDVRERLLNRGVQALYLRKEDERAYHDYVEQNISTLVKDDLLPREEACELVYQSTARVMDGVFRDPRSGRNMHRAHSMVEATVLSILKDPEALWHMTGVASCDYQTYTHCVNVSMFLVAACTDILGINSPATLKQIGLGALYHDVGKSEVPQEALSKPVESLTPAEFQSFQQHPLIGLDMATRAGDLAAPAAAVIRSHHEELDGAGYPDGLKGEQVSKVVRLATIVNLYDGLTTDQGHAPAKSPYEALEVMMKGMRGKLDLALVKSFVQFLGPMKYRQQIRSRFGGVTARLKGT
ncbi:MAG: HD-GYP domain-containing protein [Planctomycetota bacterium]|jgi:putative nucleotidyltransferase with HDIG domain